ncbi:MAG: sporulation protein [Oscillospiraceae bacterium]|nr:sporulation protein [Oscillospiraceae bacterium]
MWKTKTGSKLRDSLLGALLLAAALALATLPGETSEAAREGLALCYNVVIPSLFPFFILSSLLVELGLASGLGRALEPIMRPLFGVSGAGASALALGLVGGYPVGARTALELYQTRQCSKEEAERLLCFCNNCGPAFLLGVVGTGVFQDPAAGLLLCAVHMGSALLTGVLFRLLRPIGKRQRGAPPPSVVRAASAPAAFTSSIKGAFSSTLNICAFVVCFTVLLRLLTATGVLPRLAALLGGLLAPLGGSPEWALRLLGGMLELTTGVTALAGTGQLAGRMALASFLLGWGGLSVHCQTAALLEGSGLRMGGCLAGKLLHGLLAGGITLALARTLWGKEAAAVFAPAAEPWHSGAAVANLLPITLFFTLAVTIGAIFFTFSLYRKPKV